MDTEDTVNDNTISIPVSNANLFGEVIRSFQEQGLRYSVETTEKDFVITVTGF